MSANPTTETLPASADTPPPAVTAEIGAAGSPPVAGVTPDKAGVFYDPAKHIPKQNKHSGRWMPRGGRHKKPASVTPNSAREDSPPADLPPPDFSDLKEILSQHTGEAAKPAAPEPARTLEIVDATEEAGKVASHAAQLGAGVILKAPDAAKAAQNEHEQMSRATAAYVRSKGWQASAGFALFLVFMAYLFRVLQNPAAQKTFSGWFENNEPQTATPTPPPGQTSRAPTVSAQSSGDMPANLPPLARP